MFITSAERQVASGWRKSIFIMSYALQVHFAWLLFAFSELGYVLEDQRQVW